MRESNIRFSLTYKSLKTGQPSYLRSVLSLPSRRCTQSSSLITLSRPSLTSRLKIANNSYYRSVPVLWNSLPSDLRHVAHHVTPSPKLNLPVSDLSTSFFYLHSPSFHSCQFVFYLTCKYLWICSHWYVQLFTHYKSLPVHTVIRINIIALSDNILAFCHLSLFLSSNCYVNVNVVFASQSTTLVPRRRSPPWTTWPSQWCSAWTALASDWTAYHG